MRRALVGVLALLAACPAPKAAGPTDLRDPVDRDDPDERDQVRAELQDEILASYARDEPPEIQTAMLDPKVGAARIGVGPGDVLLGAEIERAPSRWPLDVDAATTLTTVRSKRLEISLAVDGSAAWAFDEISWRIQVCGRTAVIPLRMTALFARDGDRWVPVFEHLSFGRRPTAARAGQLPAKAIPSASTSGDLRDALSSVLQQGLLRMNQRNPALVASGPEALVVGVGTDSEWHGADIQTARLSMLDLRAEDRLVGTVGRTSGDSTIAYWVGNFVASVSSRPGQPAGKVRMRGTFVFEKRDAGWILVQGHVSQPITDDELANTVFGTSLLSPKPLELTCD